MRFAGGLAFIGLALVYGCADSRVVDACEPVTATEMVYPFTGTWDSEDSTLLCLVQHDARTVSGTWAGREALGIVNNDGTLYLARRESGRDVAVAALTLAHDTLTAQYTVPETRPVKWLRRRGTER